MHHRYCFFAADVQAVGAPGNVVVLGLASQTLVHFGELLMHCMRLKNLVEVPLAHLVVDGLHHLAFEEEKTPLVRSEVRWQSQLSMRKQMGGRWVGDVMSLVGKEIGIGCGGRDLGGMKHR